MAVLAIPFALSMGRRGSLSGIAVAIGVALAYWVIDGLFGAMGNVNYLPAALAAWSSDVLFGPSRRLSAAAGLQLKRLTEDSAPLRSLSIGFLPIQ